MELCKSPDLASVARWLAAFCFLTGTSIAVQAQDSLGDLISEFNLRMEQTDGVNRLDALRAARAVAHRIIVNHPESDEAFQILTNNNFGDLDLSKLDQEIRSLSRQRLDARLSAVGVTFDEIGSSVPEAVKKEPEATPAAMPNTDQPPERQQLQSPLAQGAAQEPYETETPSDQEVILFEALDDEEIIKRTQAALNALDCDVGTADGVIGRKTRAGHEAFIKKMNMDKSQFALGSMDLLRTLESMEGTICEKPKAIALTPSRMSGQWSFRSRCGQGSRFPNKVFTGGIGIAHQGGGTYAGRIRNSQGLNGTIQIRLSGRNARGVVNWGLLFGKVSFSVSFVDDALIAHGRDSNRCRMTVRKR